MRIKDISMEDVGVQRTCCSTTVRPLLHYCPNSRHRDVALAQQVVRVATGPPGLRDKMLYMMHVATNAMLKEPQALEHLMYGNRPSTRRRQMAPGPEGS